MHELQMWQGSQEMRNLFMPMQEQLHSYSSAVCISHEDQWETKL